MRKLLTLGCVTALSAVAVLAAGVGPAGAYIPVGPDISIAGGGYTLVNPAGPNIESNRARFEYALRVSQTTGAVYGKGVTIRGWGPSRTATDGSGFTGTRYVARMWTTTTGYPGLPADPGTGATFENCAAYTVMGDPSLGLQGFFIGNARVYLVEANGTTEHATGIQFRVLYAINDAASAAGPMIAYYLLDASNSPSLVPPPFSLAGGNGSYQPLKSGMTGVKDGVLGVCG